MSYNDQNEQGLPTDGKQKRQSASLLPQIYRTESNKKFLQSTLDQLTQPGTVKKINGYIGRKQSKASTGSDIFLEATDANRQAYQLEPAAVIKDYLGNVKFYKDYIDHINHIKVFNGDVSNHSRLNEEQIYSWNPHIDFDKFTNYQNYYWMPYGPKPINVYGKAGYIQTTMPVFVVDDGDNFAYVFNKTVQVRNPVITLYRGQTYTFDVVSKKNPFYIKTARSTGIDNLFTHNVVNNGIEKGKLTITVDRNTPDILYYVSKSDPNMSGLIKVFDSDENSYLNVEQEILHKSSYKMANGHYLSNGMKLKFHGRVSPGIYSRGYWYVEGVGSSIKLISEADIAIPSPTRHSKFDYDPYDSTAFDMASTFPHGKDYIVINRSSIDRNMWVRSNRWFHQDVIALSAELSDADPDLDQSNRATRPIIEFEPDIKLFNFGHVCKKDIDLIDNVTTDVFSTIEGSLSYYVDGVRLGHGMRVLFTADNDSIVKNNIYKVNYIQINIPGRNVSFTLDGVQPDDNSIKFPEPHGIQDGIQLTYLNEGLPNIVGLKHRTIYYAHVIDELTIKLYTNRALTKEVYIESIGTNTTTDTQSFELYTGKRRQIRLVKEPDAEPIVNEIVLVKSGTLYSGKMFWYNDSEWVQSTDKTTVNQTPLFDVFDSNEYSYSDTSIYPSSTFKGTKLFSYSEGYGIIDAELGISLLYRSINNIGDISFTFNLLSDNYSYTKSQQVITDTISAGYLQRIHALNEIEYINGWDICAVENTQAIIRIFKETTNTTEFPIDVFDEIPLDDDLIVKVYKNGVKIPDSSFSVVTKVSKKVVILDTTIQPTDILTLKLYSSVAKNENGFYEMPISLQNNPLNNDIVEFTLGQVVDHVNGITENIPDFDGVFPGSSNLRDLPNAHTYGTRFVQHLCPMNFSLYHLGSKSANIIDSIMSSEHDYGKFKRAFITIADKLGVYAEPKELVDIILSEMSKNKPVSASYYLSDMFAYAGNIKNQYEVLDSRTKTYPLSTIFSMDELSNRSVLIYLNGEQLLYGKDYTFNDDFFIVSTPLAEGDVIDVYEYDSTDGSCCPPTPSKLGLYPKFEPKIYVDDSYSTPTKVIQGHDGSITVAFNDNRDELLLELEKRIYNNIKIKYDPEMFDIYSYIPGYGRKTDYTRKEFNNILSSSFYQWTSLVRSDFTKNPTFDRFNPFTYNYRENYAPDGDEIPAYWRGIFNWMYDTDRPHTCPWEMLGFSIQPDWWEEIYGPAPYTSNNEVLWDDLRQGVIREPGRPVIINENFIRPILQHGLPVDENGTLLDPIQAGVAHGYVNMSGNTHFIMGDQSPVESAWKKSSYYPYALIRALLVMKPNDIIGRCFDRSRIHKNKSGQFIYSTGKRIRLVDLQIPSTYTSNVRIQTCGLVNFLIEHINSEVQVRLIDYVNDLKSLTNNIGSKLGGFSSKEKYKLLMDSKSPTTTSGNFVPEENYQIFLNSSSVIKKLVYSGVIITKTPEGFEVKGYSIDTPYFNVHPYLETDRTIRIGGVSESYVLWKEDSQYVSGKIVEYGSRYYRVNRTHRTGKTFDEEYYTILKELPVYGGTEVILRKTWDNRIQEVVNYGTIFATIQEVADFLQGYGAYLTNQGFVFDNYVSDAQNVSNWRTSVKEFLFWTTQNWPTNSVISLSPSAEKLKLSVPYAVINDINDDFFKYEIVDVSGTPIDSAIVRTYRNGAEFTLAINDDQMGVYGATLYAIQKEHVLILDNTTIFNDVLYDLEPGYRQERIRVLGYISKNWNGGFDIPGFVFDQASVYDWEQWTDYRFGETVKHKEFYYSAKYFIPGTAEFEPSDWIKQSDKPVPRMLPNWDYKAEQFTDFYDLDTDNFDAEQQKMAQHLIGYQKRQYLENIIKDDVSQYKFYQGMIIEKGTKNSFNKLFDVLSSSDKDSVVFNEEWAVRTGEYGALDIFDTIELELDETRVETNPQAIQFVNTIDTTINDHVYRFNPESIYIKPTEYTISQSTNEMTIWPENVKKPFLRTPGYVRYEDVDYNIDSLNDLLSTDINLYNEYDLFWCAFNNKAYNGVFRTWDVYRYEKYNGVWDSGTETDYEMRLYLDPAAIININSGDIVGIKSTEFNSFVVAEIDTTLNHLVIRDTSFEVSSVLSNVEVYVFKSVRVNDISGMGSWNIHSKKIYVDSSNGGWVVYKNVGTEFSTTIQYKINDIVIYNNVYYKAIQPSLGNLPTVTAYFAVYTGSRWSILHTERKSIDSSKIKQVYLYNKSTSEMVQYLDVVDTVYGKLPGIADQEIRYKMYQDPAVYTQGPSSVNVSPDASWNKVQIGQMWWDLTRAKFIDNNDSEIDYRTNSWNQLYETASIDVYEWVESTYMPSEWDNLADTEQGLAFGISGTSKYGDTAYSVLSRFDNITGTYYNTYYFWVQNKRILPNVPFRKLDSYNVASIISNPINNGYPCLTLSSSNSLILVNVDKLLTESNVILVIEYWNVEDTNGNFHTEWKLISESGTSEIPSSIEQKWIDSLVGYDYMDNQLPDYSLKPKQRYGVENKPRQSMFINRIEALKQVIERTNSILSNNLMVDDYDLTPLMSYDVEPSVVSGQWDVSVDYDTELKFVGTVLLEQAELSVEVTDGRITNVIINNPGYGYVNPPAIVINGNGSGNDQAKLLASIDSNGQIVSVEIDDHGEYYTNAVSVSIRPYSVLVKSDNDNLDKWSIRSWDKNNKEWIIVNGQKYDVKDHWVYKDWYTVGFNQFTGINHIVDNTASLYISSHNIGDVVKVSNVGTGGWLLLQKYSDVTSTDYTKMYNVIGRQNGTIAFLPSLYEYDVEIFPGTIENPDPYAFELKYELRIILNAIRNNILVDNLREEYMKLFFASVRYILSEQVYTDWIFKSSFIKVTHNVGKLSQKVTYNSDNLESFEEYINEVKPYRTKVREYISVYDGYDNSNSHISDFDLPAIVVDGNKYATIQSYVSDDGVLIVDNNYYSEVDPWKSWYSGVGFKISSISLIDGGSGYITAPKVRFIGGYGKDASATAFISHGRVNRIRLDNPGTGYLSAPIIVLDGGVNKPGTVARASVVIESEVARATTVSMKYDRVGKEYWLSDLLKTEQFTGTGTRLQFKLIFAPDIRTNSANVTVDGIDLLKNEYTLSVKTEYKSGYTRYYGVLTLNSAPANGGVIVVNYLKNLEYLHANDRINFYYNATPENPGKDLAQLMKGIDYGGVIVTGSGFQFAEGWDTIPWDSDEWDAFDPGFNNWSIVVPAQTDKLTLPYVPSTGEKINVYINNIRIDESNFTAAHDNIVMGTIIGDGIKNEYTIPGDIPLEAYDIAQQHSSTLVVEHYEDKNLIIDSGMETILSLTTLPIDMISKVNALTLKYEFVFKINGYFYHKEAVIFNDGTDRVIPFNFVNIPGVPNVYAGDLIISLNITNPIFLDIKFQNKTTYDIDLSFSRWDLSRGGTYENLVEKINDPLFELSSDYLDIYETELTVIDEFEKTEFYNGCYYVQLTLNDKVQFCEVELIHNGEDVSVVVVPVTPISGTSFDLVDTNPETGDLWFVGEISGDNVLLSVKTLYENVRIVYSKVMISSLALREVDPGDVRRIANEGVYVIVPFQYQATNTLAVKIDEIDITKYILCDYQLQLIGSTNTQLVDFNALLNQDMVNPTVSVVVGRSSGYFSGIKNGNIFELYFTPYEINVNVIGIKRMLVRPGATIPSHELGLDKTFSFMFIKESSDGSLPERPYDTNNNVSFNDYDNQLFGGNFENSTAVGYRPEDMITEGDNFVTPITSYAPEELLPGHMADTVSIKVYQLPTNGSPKIMYNNYIPDGVTTVYGYGQAVPSDRHVMATQRTIVNNKPKLKVIPPTSYTIDGSTNSIIFNTPFDIGSGNIAIISFGFNSESLLDTDSVTLKKASDRVPTRAPWLLGKVKSTVLVNGQTIQYELYRTDESDQNPEATGILFGSKLPKGTVIHYMIEKNESGNMFVETTSVMDIKNITYNGPGDYTLSDKVIAPNTIIMIGDKLLNPGRTFYFTMKDGNTTFRIPQYAATPFQYDEYSMKVYVNNKLMKYIRDFKLNTETNELTITKYIEDGVIILSLDDELMEYSMDRDGLILTISPLVNETIGQNMKIISFFDYGTTELERSIDKITSETAVMTNIADINTFIGKTNGVFILRKPVISTDYLWVSKNGDILKKNDDYHLDEDLIKITVSGELLPTDVIQIIAFSNNIIRGSLGYMQFKDILNRVHYKRLDKAKATTLVQDLLQDDTIIYVDNGNVLDNPKPLENIPGIIEINGERIEYFAKSGNELSQIRRGTLGTGVPDIHKITTNVLNMGPSETIPYSDSNIVESFITKRKTSVIPVSYIPNRRCDVDKNITTFVDASRTFDLDSLSINDIYDYYKITIAGEVIANGITVSTNVDDVWVRRNGSWGLVNYDISDDIEVFVSGVRLKKAWYSLYTNTDYPYSPEGDTIINPEFKVNGKGYFIKLNTSIPKGTRVVVIRKIGRYWYDSSIEDIETANNIITKFIRATDSTWPQYLVDKYQYIVSTDSNLSLETDGTGTDILELD